MSADDGVVVTENEPHPVRPDNTEAQEVAETRARRTIEDLDQGLVARRTSIDLKRAAKRCIGGHDLGRSFGKL